MTIGVIRDLQNVESVVKYSEILFWTPALKFSVFQSTPWNSVLYILWKKILIYGFLKS